MSLALSYEHKKIDALKFYGRGLSIESISESLEVPVNVVKFWVADLKSDSKDSKNSEDSKKLTGLHSALHDPALIARVRDQYTRGVEIRIIMSNNNISRAAVYRIVNDMPRRKPDSRLLIGREERDLSILQKYKFGSTLASLCAEFNKPIGFIKSICINPLEHCRPNNKIFVDQIHEMILQKKTLLQILKKTKKAKPTVRAWYRSLLVHQQYTLMKMKKPDLNSPAEPEIKTMMTDNIPFIDRIKSIITSGDFADFESVTLHFSDSNELRFTAIRRSIISTHQFVSK